MKKEKRMDRRAKAFLTVLKDGRWHEKFPSDVYRKTSTQLIQGLLKLGLIDEKATQIRRSRSHRVRFRITTRGKRALNFGEVPTTNDLRVVRLVGRLGGAHYLQGSDRYVWNQLIGTLNSHAH